MAGVPSIMRGMLPDIEHRIDGGAKVFSRTVAAPGAGEGDAAAGLAEIERRHPGVTIGSYPYFEPDRTGVNFVVRSRDKYVLELVEKELLGLAEKLIGRSD